MCGITGLLTCTGIGVATVDVRISVRVAVWLGSGVGVTTVGVGDREPGPPCFQSCTSRPKVRGPICDGGERGVQI